MMKKRSRRTITVSIAIISLGILFYFFVQTFSDNYIYELVKTHPELEKYDIQNNKGYGTKKHMDAIKKYGVTNWHRKSFAPCK